MNMNANSSTTNQWLKQASSILSSAGIETARLDSLILLEDELNTNRTHLLAHPDTSLSSEQLQRLTNVLDRRKTHKPIAYIRGKSEFYGREFLVNSHVLIPRPESETIIDLLKETAASLITSDNNAPIRVIDVGTGTGALAITAKLELPELEVIATDVDPRCLKLAQENSTKLLSDIEYIESDLLSSLRNLKPANHNLLLCNLPYVPDNFLINQAACHEPRLALYGGSDGLDIYRRLFAQLHEQVPNNTFVFTESLPFQHNELKNIALAQDFLQITDTDFIQVFQKIN